MYEMKNFIYLLDMLPTSTCLMLCCLKNFSHTEMKSIRNLEKLWRLRRNSSLIMCLKRVLALRDIL